MPPSRRSASPRRPLPRIRSRWPGGPIRRRPRPPPPRVRAPPRHRRRPQPWRVRGPRVRGRGSRRAGRPRRGLAAVRDQQHRPPPGLEPGRRPRRPRRPRCCSAGRTRAPLGDHRFLPLGPHLLQLLGQLLGERVQFTAASRDPLRRRRSVRSASPRPSAGRAWPPVRSWRWSPASVSATRGWPFPHTSARNTNAIRLYESPGNRLRHRTAFLAARVPETARQQ